MRASKCASWWRAKLLADKGLSDETYAAAEKTMGLASLVALVATTGSFSMTCMTANTFGIEPPADEPDPARGIARSKRATVAAARYFHTSAAATA